MKVFSVSFCFTLIMMVSMCVCVFSYGVCLIKWKCIHVGIWDVDVDDDNLMAMAFDDIKIIVSRFITSIQCGLVPRPPPHYILKCFDSAELKEKLLIIDAAI